MAAKKGSLVPPYHDMMWPTSQALKALGDSGKIPEIDAKASELMNLSSAQLNELHGEGPVTEVRYRMAWARTYLKTVGALENSARAVWALTDYGRSLSQHQMSDVVAQVRARSSNRGKSGGKSAPLPTEEIDDVFPSNRDEPILVEAERWQDSLLQIMQKMPPSGFEKLCQRVLRESGFTKVEVTGRSGDGGIDGVGVLRIALLSFQVFFQCKRYKGTVGPSEIRDFRGAMVGRTDKGLFITTGSFTAEAKREATRDGAPVLDLIDGDDLCGILKNLNLGVTTRQVEEVSVDAEWFGSN